MKHSAPLVQAIARAIARQGLTILTPPRLGVLVFRAVSSGRLDEMALDRLGAKPSRAHYDFVLESLLTYGVLVQIGSVRHPVAFTVLGRASVTAGEVACAIDPFAYVSHFSAMEYHGLTDRVFQSVYLTSPGSHQWQGLALELLQKELGESSDTYVNSGMPTLTRAIPSRILGKEIVVTHRSHLGAYRRLPETELRVATVGRTFFDMLREPHLCGGMPHVLDIFRDNAERNLSLITAEIDRHGKPIDKVRAGYILDEVCRLRSPEIDSWRMFVKRGGSRRLVAANEYSSEFSEKWALSLNA